MIPDVKYGVDDFLERAANQILKRDSQTKGYSKFSRYCRHYGIIADERNYLRRLVTFAPDVVSDIFERKPNRHTQGRYTSWSESAIGREERPQAEHRPVRGAWADGKIAKG